MKFLPAVVALLGSLIPCFGATITPYNLANIGYCVGSFAAGPCTGVANSSGAPITASGSATTSGESITYTASSVSRPGALGGSVSLTSDTLNSSGPGIMVDALEQLLDLVTISSPLYVNGSIGNMELFYTLDRTNSATGTDALATFGPHEVPYACVKMGINSPTFPFGCTAYDQTSVGGTFEAGVFSYVFGHAFPLWFQLESIAGTGFGAGRPTGLGSSGANFYNTATIAGVVLFDANMNPLNGTPTITSALGISYQDLSAPEPATLTLVGTVALGLLVLRRFARARK